MRFLAGAVYLVNFLAAVEPRRPPAQTAAARPAGGGWRTQRVAGEARLHAAWLHFLKVNGRACSKTVCASSNANLI